MVISAAMLRLIIGSATTSVCRIDEATVDWVASTSGAWPDTVIVSASEARPSFISTERLAPVSTSILSRTCGAKPRELGADAVVARIQRRY